MQNFNSLFWVMLVVGGILLVSCGYSNMNITKKNESNKLYTEDLSPEQNQILKNVYDFDRKFTYYYLQIIKKYPQVYDLECRMNFDHAETLTPDQPLITSFDLLKLRLVDFQNLFNANQTLALIYDEILNLGENVPDMDEKNIQALARIAFNQKLVQKYASRLKQISPSKSILKKKQNIDILPYLNVSGRQNIYFENESNYFQILKTNLPDHLWKYFALRNKSSLKMPCLQDANQKILKVKVFEQNPHRRELITQAIESYWQSNTVAIRVDFIDDIDEEGALNINWTAEPSSYVVFKDLQINIGLENEALVRKVLAHEFGHVAGFNDCYVEYYDDVFDQFVYYELNGQNIMCSLNNHFSQRIPSSYMDQLIDSYCK